MSLQFQYGRLAATGQEGASDTVAGYGLPDMRCHAWRAIYGLTTNLTAKPTD